MFERIGITIPEDFENDRPCKNFNIKAGFYTNNEFAQLLREHKHNAEAIQFLADMMEE